MLLVLDVGNTQTVAGLYEDTGHDLAAHWRVATDAQRTSDEHALLLDQLLAFEDLSFPDVEGVCISSTAPALTAALREMCARYLPDAHLVVVGPGVRTGIPIRYDTPYEVGPDRIANAVAAHDSHAGRIIVVDFGTATIFDALSAEGEYLGGALFPGLEVSLDAMFGRAAAIRRVELAAPQHVIGRTIAESVQSGTVHGFASVVEGMCERFERALGGPATVVATGRLAELVVPMVDRSIVLDPSLTLRGLRLIYRRNAA